MNFKSKQQIFDYVYKFLYKQGKRAADKNGGCKYRTHDGLKCAVGCIIPDELYSPIMEGSLYTLNDRRYKVPWYIKRNRNLLRDMQVAHDNTYASNPKKFRSDIREKFLAIALDHKLSTEVLQ